MPIYKVTSPIPPISYDLGGIPVTTFKDAEVEEIKEVPNINRITKPTNEELLAKADQIVLNWWSIYGKQEIDSTSYRTLVAIVANIII